MKYIEYKSSGTKLPFEALEFRTDLRHVLKLNGTETEIFNSFSENIKRNIKKESNQKFHLKIQNDYSGIELFYKMHCKTRKRHGLPPQPFTFFKNIYKNIISKGNGDVLFAMNGTSYTASAIYFKFGKKLLYKFGASINDNSELRGNFFVMWQAIKKYLSEGYEEFDFGRTEINHEGLRRYKLGWNTSEFFIYTSRYSVKENKFLITTTKTNGIHNSIFNHSPVFLLKLVGNSLYKHIG
ncbi:MAG: GNAT family N-acetyltransferase [Ignavibacteriota bacterium]